MRVTPVLMPIRVEPGSDLDAILPVMDAFVMPARDDVDALSRYHKTKQKRSQALRGTQVE
ncbi:MAG: hypothetical protein R2932_29775 [Caldilineaceae bacterium]